MFKISYAIIAIAFTALIGCAGNQKKEMPTPPPAPATEDVIVTRILKAPRDVVWKTWTEPERIKKWWGPKKYSAPVVKNDLRVGGKYLYAMKSPEGQTFWSTGTYKDLDVHARIIATDSFADENGNVVAPATYGMPPETPSELVVVVTFEEEERGKTTLTINHQGMPPGKMAEMTKAGWNESLDKFEVALKSRKK